LIVPVAAMPPAGNIAAQAAAADCPTEKICLWNQPNYTGKMVIQEHGQCQRPPDAANFGPIRSVKNRTTKKDNGGEWRLRMWTAGDCNCSKTCATEWNVEVRAGDQRPNLDPGQKSYEAVFVEPDCPTC